MKRTITPDILIIDKYQYSYVALLDLIDCLNEYFYGDLNSFPIEYTDRLWLPLKDIIPNNSLKSQLDVDTMSRALFSIPNKYYYSIYDRYRSDSVTEKMIKLFFRTDSRGEPFDEFSNRVYIEALFSLSDEILKKI